MDSNPTRSHRRSNSKSGSSFTRTAHSVESKEVSNLSLDLIPVQPVNTPSPSSVSRKSFNAPPLQELLLLSSSPLRKSRTRFADRIDMVEDGVEPAGATRRRCKNRGAQMGLVGCASPRNTRRLRRRSEMEMEMKEERDPGLVEEIGKARKRRNSGRSKKEKLSLVPLVPSPSPSPSTY